MRNIILFLIVAIAVYYSVYYSVCHDGRCYKAFVEMRDKHNSATEEDGDD